MAHGLMSPTIGQFVYNLLWLSSMKRYYILPQLTAFFKNVISSKQHGFFGERSTTSNLFIPYTYVNYPLEALNNGHAVHTAHTDFSKTFDRVDHIILLNKLNRYGIQGNALN